MNIACLSHGRVIACLGHMIALRDYGSPSVSKSSVSPRPHAYNFQCGDETLVGRACRIESYRTKAVFRDIESSLHRSSYSAPTVASLSYRPVRQALVKQRESPELGPHPDVSRA